MLLVAFNILQNHRAVADSKGGGGVPGAQFSSFSCSFRGKFVKLLGCSYSHNFLYFNQDTNIPMVELHPKSGKSEVLFTCTDTEIQHIQVLTLYQW